jgi:hypothetical protein
MFELKPISAGALPAALEKAERYRLLNEPAAAESICLDILEIEPLHQEALVMLLLARTDRFDETGAAGLTRAREVLPRLQDPYRRSYYAGVIFERHARALVRAARPGTLPMAYEAYRTAMEHYEQAIERKPEGNDEATLRWNTCARTLDANPQIAPRPEDHYEPALEE